MFRFPCARTLAVCVLALAAFTAGCAGAPTFQAQGPQRTDALFARIHPGMTRAEVVRVAGPPDEEMPFPLSHTYGWDYRYYDTWGYAAYYSVTFGADDRVRSTIVRRIDPGGDHL